MKESNRHQGNATATFTFPTTRYGTHATFRLKGQYNREQDQKAKVRS